MNDREEVSDTQLRLLDKVKDYLAVRSLRNKEKVANDPSCYLNSWATGSLGYLRLQCLYKGIGELPAYLYSFIRSVLNTGFCYVYKIVKSESPSSSHKYVIISWCREASFLADGSFECPYYGVNSRDLPDALWFLLSLDNISPKNIHKNINIFVKNSECKYDIFFVLKNIWRWVTRKIIPVSEVIYSHALTSAFSSKVLGASIKLVLTPYEAQSWQHALNKSAKAFDSSIKTMGYLHSSLPPLPTDYIKRDGEPDILFVNGNGQKEILQKYLGWEDKSVHVIKSLRYGKVTKKIFSGRIFIPYDFNAANSYLNLLESFLKEMDSDIHPLEVQNHPLKEKSEKHLALIEDVKNLLIRYQKFFDINSKRQISIVFGATTCVLECLARGVDVVHISSNPVYESYSGVIWRDLQINKISDHISFYKQEKKDEYICLREDKPNLEEILAYV